MLDRPCPGCKSDELVARGSRFYPFCSQDCQERDLAGWVFEGYRIQGPTRDADDEGE